MHKLGDTVKVIVNPEYDPSPESMQKVLLDVLLDVPPEEGYKTVVLTTQEMVDFYNKNN